jgi:hypothetical protein
MFCFRPPSPAVACPVLLFPSVCLGNNAYPHISLFFYLLQFPLLRYIYFSLLSSFFSLPFTFSLFIYLSAFHFSFYLFPRSVFPLYFIYLFLYAYVSAFSMFPFYFSLRLSVYLRFCPPLSLSLSLSVLVYFRSFEKMKVDLWDPHAVCVSFESLNQSLWNFVYHGIWAHLNGVLHKSLSSVCESVCVFPVSLLGNGSVKTLQRQRIHTQQYNNCWTRFFYLWGPCRIKGKQAVIPRTSWTSSSPLPFGARHR